MLKKLQLIDITWVFIYFRKKCLQRYEFFYLKACKMSSDLNTEQLKVALWQNACLNFFMLLKNNPPVSIMNRDFFRGDQVKSREDIMV